MVAVYTAVGCSNRHDNPSLDEDANRRLISRALPPSPQPPFSARSVPSRPVHPPRGGPISKRHRRSTLNFTLLFRRQDLICATLKQLLRTKYPTATNLHVQLAFSLLRMQCCYGSCVASAAWLAGQEGANEKTYDRFLRYLRRHDLATARRLHHPDGRRWVNRTSVERLWYRLVKSLGRLLLEPTAKLLKAQVGGHLCFKYRCSFGYDEKRIYALGPAPPRPVGTGKI